MSRPRRRLVPLLLLVLLVPPLAAAGAQESRVLEVDDLFEIRDVGSPVLSPDGEWVAYTVRTTSLEEEDSETRIWMVPAAGGEAIPMTAAGSSAADPRWSPDGRYLSFLSARDDGKTQVWALDRRGGEARQMTEVEQGVRLHRWSPEADRLALVLRDPEPESDQWTSEHPEPYVIDRLQFKRDYVGYLTGDRRDHIWVQDLATGDLRQVTSGPFDDGQPAWSPDGWLIAFSSNRTDEPDANSNTDIWVVDADNTDAGGTLIQVTTNPGADRSPAWSPDGEWIAHVTVTEPELIWYATAHLAVAPAPGGEARVLTEGLDRNVSSPRFAADGASIWFELEDSAERHLARIDVDGGAVERPIAGPLSVRDYDVGDDGRVVALIGEPRLPREVFTLEPGDDEPHRITRTHDEFLDGIRLGEVDNVTFESADGTEVEGFIVKPPGFDAGFRYPTLLLIHGGPVSQYDHSFDFQAQLFAAHGYVVVKTNPRGSSGYGQEFSVALWANWGNPDFEDVMAGVDHAIDLGYADPERLGVGGWSYGGILTDHVITKTDRFAAAVSGASEVLYVANYGHDHYQLQWEKELGLPWVPENREVWERLSPFNRVEQISTPTLLMGGEEDWNVPIQNSEQLYQALRRLGVPTQLVVYPDQHHGLAVPSYQKDRLQRWLDWYERWLKGGGE